MATTNVYYQVISTSLIWDNRFLFLRFTLLSLQDAASRGRAASLVEQSVGSALSRAQVNCAWGCAAKHPRRQQERRRGLVGVTSSSLDTSCRRRAGRSSCGVGAACMLPCTPKSLKKWLHLSDATPPPLYATFSLCWFENKTGVPTREAALASLYYIEVVS